MGRFSGRSNQIVGRLVGLLDVVWVDWALCVAMGWGYTYIQGVTSRPKKTDSNRREKIIEV